jgi:pyruvate ferredoxin oxidoreductase alpha subunit
VREILTKAKKVLVTDRAVSFGGPGGPVCGEIKAALYHETVKPAIYNFIIGLGGRDVSVTDFVDMVDKVARFDVNQIGETYEFWGVRE